MTTTLNTTPRQDGFRMPGEFEPHAGCCMVWPQRTDNWRYGAKPAQQAFTAVATAINQFEPLTMGVSAAQWDHARASLPDSIKLVELSSNDAWVRDTGPTCVVNNKGQVRGVDWDFNAWGGFDGGLYFPWDQDARVAAKLCDLHGLDRYKAPLILEGGSIHVDGQGTCIVTAECLLNRNRNPHLSQAQIEEYLRQYLNVDCIIWIPRGVFMDETDGHVDNMLCIPRPGEVIVHGCDDAKDPQYERTQEALEILSKVRDAQGRSLKVHTLPQPGPMYLTQAESEGVDSVPGTAPRRAGDRLAGSYINHYIANGGIVAPMFGVEQDAVALQLLKAIYPERTIATVPGREILLGGGNIHCITQQIPAPQMA